MKRATATKMPDAVERARVRLRAAIDRACIARGEAQWTNGYRAGARERIPADEELRLYRKEIGQFEHCGVAERTAERAMRAYARAVAGASRSCKR